MTRKNIYFSDEQLESLSKLSGIFSEHVRRAIDEYIEKQFAKTSSLSPSKKGGNKYGRIDKSSPSA